MSRLANKVAIITGAVCGLAPAFASLRTKVNDTLKEGGRSGSQGSGHARLRSVLVVGEIAIALVLLAACGLLLRSFEKMREFDLGFRPDHTLMAGYSLPQKQYSTQAQVDSFNDELLRRVRELPGALSAGITTLMPATGSNSNSTFIVEGYVPPQGAGLNLATPMLIRESPLPLRRVIGDLSDMEKVFEALELHEVQERAQRRNALPGGALGHAAGFSRI